MKQDTKRFLKILQMRQTKFLLPMSISALTKGRFPLQPYRTETYCISLFPSTRVELMVSTQKKILRYVTIRLKWKPALSLSSTSTVSYRNVSSVFLCFLSTGVELMISIQKKIVYYGTLRYD